MVRLAIIADDLTGAADSAGAFAALGHRTVLSMRGSPAGDADVLSLSTESRDLDAAEARQAIIDTLARIPASPHTRIFKKIDSALRGQIGAEIDALLTALCFDTAVVAPALPSERRTTVGGRQMIDGKPLATRFPGSSGEIAALFASSERPVSHCSQRDLQSDPNLLRQRRGIVVVDAETEGDLAAVALACRERSDCLLTGSAGLSRQVAGTLDVSPGRVASQPPSIQKPVLVIAGSRHDATARQIRQLEHAGVCVARPTSEELSRRDLGRVANELCDQLCGMNHAVFTTSGMEQSGLPPREIAGILGSIVTHDRVRANLGALVLTGGDVADAVCRALGASTIELRGEVRPALPWGILRDEATEELPLVTKAGSFGTDDALEKCVRWFGFDSPPAGLARTSQAADPGD